MIVASPLTLVFHESENGSHESGNRPSSSVIGPGLHMLDPIYLEGRDEYTLPIGRNSSVSDRFNEAVIPLQESQGRHRKITLVVRLYNDGLAFRWVFPRQTKLEKL